MIAEQLDFLTDFSCLSERLQNAVKSLHEGKPVLLLDDSDRENEGDLVIAAEKITANSMNFMIRQGSGVVCLAMPKDRLDGLNLPAMMQQNTNNFETAFTVSIEAVSGVTTGVSAHDRAHTIRTAIADDARPEHLARPGHVFPLAARMGGVFERMGHTEGSVDLMKIAQLRPGAVLCELMNPDGSMTIGHDRIAFAQKFNIPLLFVDDILFHRIKTENIFSEHRQKSIFSHFGPLLWHQFFALGLTLDIFLPQGLKFEDKVPIIITDGTNLHNRFLAQVLNQTEDDSLIQALSLKKGVVVMMSGSNNQKRNLAIMCRALCELGVKKLVIDAQHQQLYTIAKNHFFINC